MICDIVSPLKFYNKIASANLPALIRFQNNYEGEPIVFAPLAIRVLLLKCQENNAQFEKLINLLLNGFPLAKESREEVRTANLVWNIFKDRMDFVRAELQDPTWTIKPFPDEIGFLASVCQEERISPCQPAFGEFSAEIAKIINMRR
jgi:hypothetical protein